MKTCGNCLASNERNSVVFFDSHDLYYCWGVTKKLDRNTIIKEWEYLLKKHPEADVLFFPHPNKNEKKPISTTNTIIIFSFIFIPSILLPTSVCV